MAGDPAKSRLAARWRIGNDKQRLNPCRQQLLLHSEIDARLRRLRAPFCCKAPIGGQCPTDEGEYHCEVMTRSRLLHNRNSSAWD